MCATRVETWLEGRCWIFDPSGTAIPLGFTRFAAGRDAADFVDATLFGDIRPVSRRLQISAVAGPDGVLRQPGHAAQAVSTASA